MLYSILSRSTIFTLMLLPVLGAPAPVFAQSDEAIEASRRVNIAGRQRMLSQRMSKAACFISSGVNVDLHFDMLSDSFSLFSASHDALRSGDVDIGLNAETNAVVLNALRTVDRRWQEFSPEVQAIISSGIGTQENTLAIGKSGLSVLRDMNSAVGIIARTYGDLLEDMPLIQSITIDLAGRQRMLTQKAAKEFCLIDSGIYAEVNRENLTETILNFSNTLDALINGLTGFVMAPPSEQVFDKLIEVETAWVAPYEVLARVADGDEITDEDRQLIAEQIDNVLTLMNQAVGMYELGP
ncbi:MAG: type IV pili methyl-accepting chemotaxis transducer N-terminal domain-containing protein [Rhodobacteraceae bacterium]|nr:type IV pili methyl-accepting chemotaxis transducer N-terminal domain-containing protein [Paracoccaceae bacterium]